MTPINYNDPNEMWRHNGYDPYKGMSDEERMKAGCFQLVGIVCGIIVALLICALFGSCTTTKYVPVPEYHTDTVRITKHTHDSIYLSDSIYVNDFVRDDTVYKTIERWRTKYVEKQVHDTTYIAKVDTIREVFTNEVEKPLTWWQQTKMHIGAIALYLLALLAVIWVAKRHLGKL